MSAIVPVPSWCLSSTGMNRLAYFQGPQTAHQSPLCHSCRISFDMRAIKRRRFQAPHIGGTSYSDGALGYLPGQVSTFATTSPAVTIQHSACNTHWPYAGPSSTRLQTSHQSQAIKAVPEHQACCMDQSCVASSMNLNQDFDRLGKATRDPYMAIPKHFDNSPRAPCGAMSSNVPIPALEGPSSASFAQSTTRPGSLSRPGQMSIKSSTASAVDWTPDVDCKPPSSTADDYMLGASLFDDHLSDINSLDPMMSRLSPTPRNGSLPSACMPELMSSQPADALQDILSAACEPPGGDDHIVAQFEGDKCSPSLLLQQPLSQTTPALPGTDLSTCQAIAPPYPSAIIPNEFDLLLDTTSDTTPSLPLQSYLPAISPPLLDEFASNDCYNLPPSMAFHGQEQFLSPSTLPYDSQFEDQDHESTVYDEYPPFDDDTMLYRHDGRLARPPAEASAFASSQDKELDGLLLQLHAEGKPYRLIKQLTGFEGAESTLRGRIRNLKKRKEERPRKPEWPPSSVSFVAHAFWNLLPWVLRLLFFCNANNEIARSGASLLRSRPAHTMSKTSPLMAMLSRSRD
jgi:hypothetical protein